MSKWQCIRVISDPCIDRPLELYVGSSEKRSTVMEEHCSSFLVIQDSVYDEVLPVCLQNVCYVHAIDLHASWSMTQSRDLPCINGIIGIFLFNQREKLNSK